MGKRSDYHSRHAEQKPQTIIISGRTESENLIIKGKIEPATHNLGLINYITMQPQGVRSAIDPSVSVVVLSMLASDSDCRIIIADIRRVGYRGPILVISRQEAAVSTDVLQAMENVVFLERPYELKDLQGMVRKFVMAKNVAQRIHRRYNTDQRAHIELIQKRERSVSTVLNLSRGGCYLLLPRTSTVKVGDIIRMRIELEQVRRQYEVPAKVVWTSKNSGEGMVGISVGAEFLGRPYPSMIGQSSR